MNSYLFVKGGEIYKFKAKVSEINAAPLCMGNVSKDFTTDNVKKNGLQGYIYIYIYIYISVDYDSIDMDDILDVHKNLKI